jgi:serine/threonine-protein kinase
MLEPGQTVGNYRVEEELGMGGMALVYRVKHVALESDHALKVLLPHLLRDERFLDRFLEEAKLQARFRHPSLVRVTDIVSEPGIAGLVMDYLEGETLEHRLDRAPIKITEAVRWAYQATGALSYIHTRGVVHRDVKPGNLFVEQVTGQGTQIRLMDFGIAKVHTTQRTRTAVAMGTPAYMSPEQVKAAKHVDARSDIFSLGAVLYEMLTGRLAFDGESEYVIQQKILAGEYTPIRDLNASVSEHLAAVVDKALKVIPAERFSHARSMAKQLAASTEGREIPAYWE